MKNKKLVLLSLVAILLSLPPFHETVHALIGRLLGWKVVKINYWAFTILKPTRDAANTAFFNWVQQMWEFVQLSALAYLFVLPILLAIKFIREKKERGRKGRRGGEEGGEEKTEIIFID